MTEVYHTQLPIYFPIATIDTNSSFSTLNEFTPKSFQIQHEQNRDDNPFRKDKTPFTPEDAPKMIANIYLGRDLAFYYNTALLTLIGVVSIQYWSHRLYKAFDSKPRKKRLDSKRSSIVSPTFTTISTAPSSLIQEYNQQPNILTQHFDNEQTPLLGSNNSVSWWTRRTWSLNSRSLHRLYCQISGYLIKQSEIDVDYPVVSHGLNLSIISYYIINLIFCFYKVPVFTHPVLLAFRLGVVSSVNIPLLYLFGTKHSPISLFTGWSYEQLNILHQHIGNICCKTLVLHASIFLVYFRLQYMFTHLWSITGFIAGFCFLFILISAYPCIKQRSYELFYVIHIVGFVVCLPALWFHHPFTRPYVLLAVLSLIYDRTIRLFKDYRLVYSKVELRAGDTILIRVPINGGVANEEDRDTYDCGGFNNTDAGSHSNRRNKNKAIQKFISALLPARPLVPWHPGQHAFVTVIGCGLFESHPFTIASNYQTSWESSQSSNDALVGKLNGPMYGTMDLIIRAREGFTRRLYNQTVARLGGLFFDGLEDWRWVIVHGPYGTPIDRPKSVVTLKDSATSIYQSDDDHTESWRQTCCQSPSELSACENSKGKGLATPSTVEEMEGYKATLVSSRSYSTCENETFSAPSSITGGSIRTLDRVRPKVVLVAGGAGVAFTYPIYEEYRKNELQSKHMQNVNSFSSMVTFPQMGSLRENTIQLLDVPSVQFFWIIPDRSFLKWLPANFQQAVAEEEAKVLRGEINEQQASIRIWITKERGSRPNIKKEVKAMITSGLADSDGENIEKDRIRGWAGVCGPDKVVRDVRNSIGELRQEGYLNVSVYTEVFGR